MQVQMHGSAERAVQALVSAADQASYFWFCVPHQAKLSTRDWHRRRLVDRFIFDALMGLFGRLWQKQAFVRHMATKPFIGGDSEEETNRPPKTPRTSPPTRTASPPSSATRSWWTSCWA